MTNHDIIRIAIIIGAGFIGSVGFALIFGVAKKHFAFALISSILSSLAFELVLLFTKEIFVSAFVSAGLAAAYSEFMAHRIKVPATVMIIIGIIPLVPGAKLYYTMLGIVRDDMVAFSSNGESTLLIAAGIAVGIISVTAISRSINAMLGEISNKKNKTAKDK